MLFNKYSFDALNSSIVSKLYDSLIISYDYLGVPSESLLPPTTYKPAIFARYYDLVILLSSKNKKKALQISEEITELQSNQMRKVTLDILPFSKDYLGEDYERFSRLLFAEYSNGADFPITEPSFAKYNQHKLVVLDAISLIQKVSPKAFLILEALVCEIYIAEGRGVGFGGVTSFMVWGGVFINANHYSDKHAVVEALVHELTHCALFAINSQNRLIMNSPDESYPSALRGTNRPMDGVFHAFLVCANVTLFMDQWSQLKDNTCKKIIDMKNRNKHCFYKMLPIIEKHGKLSGEATLLLKDAKSQMEKI